MKSLILVKTFDPNRGSTSANVDFSLIHDSGPVTTVLLPKMRIRLSIGAIRRKPTRIP